MQKVVVLLVCCMFCVVSFCFAGGQKKVDNPTIEMLQGKWEGKYTRLLTKKNSSGQFEMKIKDKKAFVTRAATYTDAATSWVVTIDKIDKGKIFMSSRSSEFELELYSNDKGEFFLEGDYTGWKPGVSMGQSMNSSLTLQRTSTTVEEKGIPGEAVKE